MQAVLIRRHKPRYYNLWSVYKASLPDVQGESANMVMNSHDVYHLLFTTAEISVEREYIYKIFPFLSFLRLGVYVHTYTSLFIGVPIYS